MEKERDECFMPEAASLQSLIEAYFSGEEIKKDLATLKGEARMKILLKLSEIMEEKENEMQLSDPLVEMFRRIGVRF